MRLPSLLLIGFLCAAGSTPATEYFVSPSGHDQNTGTSEDRAWHGLERANQTRFLPGDRLLFRGGETFSGTIRLDATGAGLPEKPIVISSFGSGRATLQAGRMSGLLAQNVAGLVISNLTVVGVGLEAN